MSFPHVERWILGRPFSELEQEYLAGIIAVLPILNSQGGLWKEAE